MYYELRYVSFMTRGRRDHDRMVDGFIITYALSTNHH